MMFMARKRNLFLWYQSSVIFFRVRHIIFLNFHILVCINRIGTRFLASSPFSPDKSAKFGWDQCTGISFFFFFLAIDVFCQRQTNV